MGYSIRLKKFGDSKKLDYKLVVMISGRGLDGIILGIIGRYSQISLIGNIFQRELYLDKTELVYWLKKGAVCSKRIKKLISMSNVVFK